MISCGWFGEGKGECVLPQGHRGVHAFDCRECNGKGTQRGKMFKAIVRCVRCDGTGIEPTERTSGAVEK